MASNLSNIIMIVIYLLFTMSVGFFLAVSFQEFFSLKILFIFPIGTIIFGSILTSGLYWGLLKKGVKTNLFLYFICPLIGGLMFWAVYYWNYKFTYREIPITFFEYLKLTIENTEVYFFYRSPSTATVPVQAIWYNYLSFGIYFLGAMFGSVLPMFLLTAPDRSEGDTASEERDVRDETVDYFGLGITCFNDGIYERAIKNLKKTIELHPEHDAAYCLRGQSFYQIGKYERAIKDFDKAIELFADCSWYHFNRGLCYYSLKNFGKAISNFLTSVKLEPDCLDGYHYLGLCNYELGDYESALVYFNKVIQLSPNRARFYRGRCLFKLNQFERAIIDFDKDIDSFPDSEKAYYWRGLCYYELSDYLRAVADFNKTVALKPDWEKAFYWRGVCYFELGFYGRAIFDFDNSLEINPNLKEAFFKRGRVFEKLEKWDEANRDFERATRLE